MVDVTQGEITMRLAKDRHRSIVAIKVYLCILCLLIVLLWLLRLLFGLPLWIVISIIGLQVGFIVMDLINVLIASIRLRRLHGVS